MALSCNVYPEFTYNFSLSKDSWDSLTTTPDQDFINKNTLEQLET